MYSLLKNIVTLFVAVLFGDVMITSCGPSARKGYRIENGEVAHYSGFPATRAIIGEADAESFTAINDMYGTDKRHAYYLVYVIPNADPATFTYLGGSYSKDKNSGYSRDQLISNDGVHFNVVPNPEESDMDVTAQGIAYARDKHRVYTDVMTVEGADPATFVFEPMFNGNYLTRDHRSVYFQNKPIEGVDGATFRKVSSQHFTDKKGAWGLVLGRDIYWTPIEKADLATFTAAGRDYARDKYRVYSGPDTLRGADPKAFQEILSRR